MEELFYSWFNENKEKLQQMGIETDLISKPTSTSSPAIFADHLTEIKVGRVTVWNSGSINLEILDQSSGETVYHKHFEISDKTPNIENLLADYFKVLLSQS